jgi:Tol biopolymer transport system component
MERSLIVIILIILVASVNCGEDSSDGWLETRRGDDGRELVYDPFETRDSWLLNPTVSPDGTRVAFNVHFEDETYPYGIVVLELDSGKTTVLIEEECGHARWSPSGEWIAYATFEGPGTLYNVYLIRPDGSEKRPAVVDLSDDSPSDWLSDGNKLLYSTTLVKYSRNLAIYDLSTETKTMVTDFDDRSYMFRPALSPDDGWIAGTQLQKNDWYGWAMQLTYARMDGTDYFVEIREDYVYFNGGVIDWSPDGRYLLFVLIIGGCNYEDKELWTYDTKTGAFEQLTMAPEGYSVPGYPQVKYETIQGAEWGPDGYIYFAANNNLYRIRAPE